MDFIQIMEWWSNLPQDQKEKCYFYMNGKKVEPRPFDKLKELWDEWRKADDCRRFEIWFKENKLNQRIISRDNVLLEAYQQLRDYCGFLTTAEVRQAIQELKNS